MIIVESTDARDFCKQLEKFIEGHTVREIQYSRSGNRYSALVFYEFKEVE